MLRIQTVFAGAGAVALALAACAAPTAPAEPAEDAKRLTLSTSSLELTAPGDTATVVARLGDQYTERPSLSIESETRYARSLPVLDLQALAAGRVRAAAAGSAVLRVSAFGAQPARVQVKVRPDAPWVLGVRAGAGDTVHLDGYQLSGVGGIRVGDEGVRVLSSDSAGLRIVVSPVRDAACRSGRVEQPLSAQGAAIAPGLRVARRHVDEVRLAVGESLRLPSASTACLRLAPEAGAAYALAFLDVRKVRRARTGFEGYIPSALHYSVNVTEGAPAPSASALAANAPAAHRRAVQHAGAPRRTTAEAQTLYSRSEPWRVGEPLRIPGLHEDSLVTATVRGTYAGWLVLATVDGAARPEWLAQVDTALRHFVSHGGPLFAHVLGAQRPLTSASNRQMLVIADRGTGFLGFTQTRHLEGRPHSFVVLDAGMETGGASGLLRVLAHEVAHAWMSEHFGGEPYGTGWAVEGTADLLSWLTLARSVGVSQHENWRWREQAGDARLRPATALPRDTGDDFALGYASAASFLLDAAGRLARRGVSFDDAVREVSRGALEGWFGWSSDGPRRRGLADRVRPTLGAGWDPEEALLAWTLSQAVDDRLSSAEFQNPVFHRAGVASAGETGGWGPAAVLRSGENAVAGDPGTAAVVQGNGVTTWPIYGSPGYVRIEDGGRGGAYRLSAAWNGAALGDVAWVVLRER